MVPELRSGAEVSAAFTGGTTISLIDRLDMRNGRASEERMYVDNALLLEQRRHWLTRNAPCGAVVEGVLVPGTEDLDTARHSAFEDARRRVLSAVIAPATRVRQ